MGRGHLFLHTGQPAPCGAAVEQQGGEAGGPLGQEDPEAIIADILPGLEGSGTPYQVICDRVEAIHWAMDHAQPGDVIALCGKGHETYQEVNHEKHHMDEREIVAEHLTGK